MSSDPSASAAPAAGDIAIRVRDVSKSYVLFDRPEDRFKQMVVPRLERLVGRPPRRYFRDFAALSGVSFEIGRGETVGNVGRNGSGKSTLLQIVCGTLQPSAGSVEVNGRIAALLELGAGFNPEFTGRENVFLNASILGVPRREMEWRFDDIARFADIGPFLDQPVKTYSSGMYLRLAFATAVNVDPDILVVDEALAVGDEAFQRKCFARIEDIKDRGGTILFVSHGAQAIVQLCTRAMLIDGGELILQGRPKMVTGQYQRLVNASEEGAREIKAGIAAMGNTAEETMATMATAPVPVYESNAGEESADDGAEISVAKRGTARDTVTPADLGYVDYFDPNLKSQTVMALEERGGRIRDVRILTVSGQHVNVLQMGRRYVVEYAVDFSSNTEKVGFEFLFKTVTGLVVAGSDTNRSTQYKLASVRSGASAIIRFSFNCLLLPGTYLVSAGVRGRVKDEAVMLHKIVEAILIRVANEPNLEAIGYASLDAVPQIVLTQAQVPMR